MKKLLIICLSALAANLSYAQKEANNWFFGLNAGLTWNTTRDFSATGAFGTSSGTTTLTGLPTEVTGSPIFTLEGCFSLSDNDGNLLFYSDGVTVWNRNNAVMPNGSELKGNNSSAQSGIVLPYPGSAAKYIAASLGEADNDTLAYSVVDMNPITNGGYADGAVTEKNIRLSGHSGTLGESVSAIAHSNGRDYWIVAPSRYQYPAASIPLTMNAWRVTSAGIENTTPVITEFENITVSAFPSGYLKFSPGGNHFAWGTWRSFPQPKLIIGNFNPSTGTCSNVTSIDISIDGNGPYGIEFSESGKYLYITIVGISSSGSDSELRVYDFEALLNASDPTSSTLYTSYKEAGMGTLGAVQLGPDGRMYVKQGYTDFSDLSDDMDEDTWNYKDTSTSQSFYVIENPEEPGNLKIHILNNFLTGTNIAALGLPSFSASWWDSGVIEIEPEMPVCAGTEVTFTVSLNPDEISQIARVFWDFGDGGTYYDTSSITASPLVQKYTYKKRGSYTFQLLAYDSSNKLITNFERTTVVNINSCALPVNHNVAVAEGSSE